MNKCLKEYCVGCGLCVAIGKAKCEVDTKGYFYPVSGDEEWLKKVCPSYGNQEKIINSHELWGHCEEVYLGWSTDKMVRNAASSGGALTEIAAFLLDSNYVDSILHICVDPESPTRTIVCESQSRAELIERCGSRYTISHPLLGIEFLDRKKKYAVIAKPCDIIALKNYMKIEPNLNSNIVITLSFFCAGLPSFDSQRNLLKYLGCSEDKIRTLKYRGNGWPGYTTAIDSAEKEYKTDYDTAWGKILGRDIMKMCRFCIDGIGELADISCGDAWYLTPDKKPDFSENEGRNVIFARTSVGNDVLREMSNSGCLHIEEFKAYKDELSYIQYFQKERRTTMIAKKMAMLFMGHSFPKYSVKRMLHYYSESNWKDFFRVFKGTIKRAIQKKI